jgi:hypothetical protein
MMRRFLLLASLLTACNAKRTEVLVFIHNSDLTIGQDVDQLTLVVRDRTDNNTIRFSLGHGSDQTQSPQPLCHDQLTDNCYNLPLSITLYPGSYREDVVEVAVTAYRGATALIVDVATFQFTPDTTQRLDFYLYKSCLGTFCGAQDQLCGADGTCQGSPLIPDGGIADAPPAPDIATPHDLAGPAWVAIKALPGPVGGVRQLWVPPPNPSMLYAVTATQLFRSDDSGASWGMNNLLPAGGSTSAIAFDPSNAMNVYVGGNSALQESMDAGQNWGTLLNQNVTTVGIDGMNHWVYVSISGTSLQVNNGSGWVMLNDGLTGNPTTGGSDSAYAYIATSDDRLWRLPRGTIGAWANLPGAPPSLTSIFADAANVLYAVGGFSGRVKKSVDRANWLPVTIPSVGFNTLYPHPSNADIMYAATSMGVYKMVGGAWFPKNEGIVDTNIQSLAIDTSNPDTLYAGTSSGVIYRTTTGGE